MSKTSFYETKHVQFTEEEYEHNVKIEHNAEKKVENKPFLHNDYNCFLTFFSINSIIHLMKLYFQKVHIGKPVVLSDFPNLSKRGDIRQYSKALTTSFESLIVLNNGKITELQVLKILCKIFWLYLLGSWILWAITSILTLMSSYYMYRLIQTFETNEVDDMKTFWGSILAFNLLGVWIFIRSSQFLTYNLGTKIRLTIVQSLYEKILTLNNSSAQKANLGKMINLLSSNLNFFEIKHMNMFIMLTTPFTLLLTFYILYLLIGIVMFMILIILAIIYASQKYLAKKNVKNITEKNMLLDQRIKKTSEMIEIIRSLKIYGWEMGLKKLINKLRVKEISSLFYYNFIILIDRTIGNDMSAFCSVFFFFLLYLLYENVDSFLMTSVVMSFYQILEYMRRYQILAVGGGLSGFYEGKVLFRRIIDVLTIQNEKVSNQENVETSPLEENIKVKMSDFSAYWSVDSDTPVLKNISLCFESKKIYSIIGKVGSGKSTFLYSILGEMPKSTGLIQNSKSIAYVEQDPFIMAGTLRNNIIFYRDFNEDLYRQVIQASCLEPDIEALPKGDLTELGDNGLNISGGQKARISLARALYSQAELYLLDDPFSALDALVGLKVFDKAIKSFLKEKCVVLVTHQLQYLKDTDYIFCFESGVITKKGTSDNILNVISDLEEKEDEEVKNVESNNKLSKKKENPQNLLIPSPPKIEYHANFSTYWKYFGIGSSLKLSFICILLFLICEIIRFEINSMLSCFGTEEYEIQTIFLTLWILVIGQIATFVLKYYVFCKLVHKSNLKIHKKMIKSVVRSPMTFFDQNTTGVILNRFSNDLGLLDSVLISSLIEFFEIVFSFLCALFVLSYLENSFAVCFSAICLLIYGFIHISKPVLLRILNVDLENKSLLFAIFSTTVRGLSTINVYGQNKNFFNEFSVVVTNAARSNYLYWEITRGLVFVLDLLTKLGLIFGIVTILTTNMSASVVGQILSYLIRITSNISFGINQMIVCDGLMCAFLRCSNYCDLPSEDELIKPGEEKMQTKNCFKTNERLQNSLEWPSKGEIAFQNIELTYPGNNDPSLRKFSVSIKPGEKIGIVGRTGAGKSSILNILFRLYDISDGKIFIDGQNIHELGLHTLRKKISIIPQSPFVFAGTIRDNLDPENLYSDEEIWCALDILELTKFIQNLEKNIMTEINNSQNVFSAGQLQLLSLARVLLKKNKILVLDEATARMDMETDKIIQKIIKNVFKDCTILTIAHRISTIADYNKVVVMEKGMIMEFEAPFLLLSDKENNGVITKDGYFAKMVKSLKMEESIKILTLAREHFLEDI